MNTERSDRTPNAVLSANKDSLRSAETALVPRPCLVRQDRYTSIGLVDGRPEGWRDAKIAKWLPKKTLPETKSIRKGAAEKPSRLHPKGHTVSPSAVLVKTHLTGTCPVCHVHSLRHAVETVIRVVWWRISERGICSRPLWVAVFGHSSTCGVNFFEVHLSEQYETQNCN